MPPQFLFDLSRIDLNQVLFGPEQIREVNPQRGDMEHLDAVIWVDTTQGGLVGKKVVRENEFWVPGHIPGRPLLPGVLMIEAAAQLACFYTKKYLGMQGFIGFGGTGPTKFRLEVKPGQTLYLLSKHTWTRHRRIGSVCQGMVNGQLAFETEIIGAQM
ncbi:MAG: beta-hydroxyacyl-ACP dehydratase [Phycisphaerae bacterium]|jgi:3-hydroxyacyl-[acyl-carrier-protein] dehydratase|nr:MAG: beta-hydroxyacyl-ACP dehydratase [Phycisphaerae bacterium]